MVTGLKDEDAFLQRSQANEEYTPKLSNVFESCITEYRKMAERTYRYEADAERVNQ